VFLSHLIRAAILFVSSNWSDVEVRITDTFPRLCVNEAGYGGKGQALDLPFSPRALSSRGRRTPQTIKHVASQGRAAALLLVREVFTVVGCCWSLFRAIICRSEQSIQP